MPHCHWVGSHTHVHEAGVLLALAEVGPLGALVVHVAALVADEGRLGLDTANRTNVDL